MISRRKFFGKSPVLLSPAFLSLAACQTVKGNDLRPQPSDLYAPFRDDFGFQGPDNDPVFSNGENPARLATGEAKSRHDEVRKAFKLLWDSPRTNDHMSIVRYFEGLKDSNPNELDLSGAEAKYNEEWRTRANPLITSFFAMTNTLPAKGDQTPWCAAFVSFILYAANKPNKFSALSGAYRKYSYSTNHPQLGDIVVFRKNGPDGDKGFGHVGFYINQTDTTVRVLGGNQRGTSGSTGAIIERDYEKSGSHLSLHSYRMVF
ncbi:MAG: CHAP domain-containing protein [Maricaulaceae bacterium]